MNNNTYVFSSLAAKHKNFGNPCCFVKAGGIDITALGLYIDGLNIQLTIKDKSGQCKFSILNAYDISQRKFRDAITAHFPLGQQIEAGIGYGQPTDLFKGFVSDVSFSFSSNGSPKATIAASDIRALMLQGRLNAMLPFTATFAIMMPMLMAYYTSIFNMRVVYYDFWNILEDFRQNTDDFHYIYNYAEKRGYEFFIMGDYSYFRRRWEDTMPLMTLSWGENIISFDRNFTYSKSALKGTLNSILSLIPFVSDELLAPSYPFKVVTPQVPKFDTNASAAKNNLDLINILATDLHKFGDDMAGGKVTCIGLPEIIPGRYIKIENLDKTLLDKKYYIPEVTHSFSGSGYTTSFEITSGK